MHLCPPHITRRDTTRQENRVRCGGLRHNTTRQDKNRALSQISKAWLTQSRFYRRPSATRQSRGGRGMVGSSVVYCRRCCRAWSSVVTWFVVALFGRLRVLKCSKLSGDHRRPKFLSSVVVGQL